jgi:hypothetical protein
LLPVVTVPEYTCIEDLGIMLEYIRLCVCTQVFRGSLLIVCSRCARETILYINCIVRAEPSPMRGQEARFRHSDVLLLAALDQVLHSIFRRSSNQMSDPGFPTDSEGACMPPNPLVEVLVLPNLPQAIGHLEAGILSVDAFVKLSRH